MGLITLRTFRNCLCVVPNFFFLVSSLYGRLQRRKSSAIQLGKRENREIRDQDFVLSVKVTQDLLTNIPTLYLLWKWVPGTEITQHVTGHGHISGGCSSVSGHAGGEGEGKERESWEMGL